MERKVHSTLSCSQIDCTNANSPADSARNPWSTCHAVTCPPVRAARRRSASESAPPETAQCSSARFGKLARDERALASDDAKSASVMARMARYVLSSTAVEHVAVHVLDAFLLPLRASIQPPMTRLHRCRLPTDLRQATSAKELPQTSVPSLLR